MVGDGAFATALLAALLVVLPISVLCTKVVDGLRSLFDKQGAAPSWVWNLTAFVVGTAVAAGWGINVLGAVIAAIPAMAESDFGKGWGGTILTGLIIGGMAGFWKDKLSQWQAAAAARRSHV